MRRLYTIFLASTFLTVPTAAVAEPISTAIGLTALIGGLGVSTTFAGVIGGAIIGTAFAVGASLISNTLSGSAGGAVNTEQTPQRDVARGTTLNVQYGGALPRQALMGPGATAGHHIYANVYGSENSFLQCVFVVGDGLHGDIVKLWYNGKVATLVTSLLGSGDPVGGDAILQFRGRPQGGSDTDSDIDHVWVRWFNGTTTQTADADLVTYANPSTRWSNNHVGTGICYLSITQKYNEAMGLTGVPNVLIEHEGLMLYDFRKDSTNGGSGPHRWGTPSTYEPSANPAVQEYNFRRGVFIGSHRVMGMNIQPGDLYLPMYQAAANICDETVPLAGSPVATELRYRCAVVVSDGRAPSEALETMRGAMAGFTLERAGQFGPIAGVAQFSYTDLTITDDDLEVGTPAPFAKYRSRSNIATAVHGHFSDPEQKWATAAFPARELAADDTLYGEKLARSVDLTQVYSSSQAQRIAEIMRRRTLQEGAGSLTVGPKWIGVQPGDWLPYNSSRHGSMTILITGVRIDPQRHNVTLAYEKIASSVYTWTTAGEIERPAVPIDGAPGTLISAASNMVATAVTLLGGNNASRPAIKFTWNAIYDPSVNRILFEIRENASPADLVGTFAANYPTSGVAITANGIQANTAYEFRHRLETVPVRATSWSAWTDVVTGDTEVLQDDLVITDNLVANAATRVDTATYGGASLAWNQTFQMVSSLTITSSGTGKYVIIGHVEIGSNGFINNNNLDPFRWNYRLRLDGTSTIDSGIIWPQTTGVVGGPTLVGSLVGHYTLEASVDLASGSHTVVMEMQSNTSNGALSLSVTDSTLIALEAKKQS